jgi:hypothetical protein
MKKNILIYLLCVIFPFSGTTQVFSGGGTGTESDPYVILTAADLVAIHDVSYNANAYTYFRMDADVDLAGVEWAAFNTTGTFDKPVYFDGNGHVIKNLDTGGYNYAGLFGILRGVCKNLGVVNAKVGNSSTKYDGTAATSCATAGIIAGYLANNNYTTAIAQGVIENCYTTGVVSSTQVAGGLVGSLGRPASGSGHPVSYIRNCYSKADVSVSSTSGNARAGGIVGVVTKPGGVTPAPIEVEFCFSTGNVTAGSATANNGPGGVVGYSDLPLNRLVSLNASVVRPDNAHDQYGRIAAVVTGNSLTTTECWALETVNITKNSILKSVFTETTPITDYKSYDGVSKTAQFLSQINNWAAFGFDIVNVWHNELGTDGHPILKWQHVSSTNPATSVHNPTQHIDFFVQDKLLKIVSDKLIDSASIYSTSGILVANISDKKNELSVKLPYPGIYFISVYQGNKKTIEKICIQ